MICSVPATILRGSLELAPQDDGGVNKYKGGQRRGRAVPAIYLKTSSWRVGTRCPPYDRFAASVRSVTSIASSNNAAASRNGAPGNFTGACVPMK